MFFEINNYVLSGILIGITVMVFFVVHYQIPYTADNKPNKFLLLIILVFILKKVLQFYYPNEEDYNASAGGLLYVYSVLLSALGFFYVKYEISRVNELLFDIIKLALLIGYVFVSSYLMYFFDVSDLYFLIYDISLILIVVFYYVKEFVSLIQLINVHPGKVTRKKIFWYRFVFYGIVSYQICVEIVEFMYVNKWISTFSHRNFVLNSISIVYILTYTVYSIYNGYLLIFFSKKAEIRQNIDLKIDFFESNIKTAVNSEYDLLSDEKSISIFNTFQQKVTNEKLFMNEEIKIEDISRLINVNTKYLSFSINRNTGKSFPDFINALRVEEVNKRLSDPEYKNLTIMAIANDCGFGSKSCFNRVYKKHTGMSPSEYQIARINKRN